jgi:hypothetical protein
MLPALLPPLLLTLREKGRIHVSYSVSFSVTLVFFVSALTDV